jgi:hypothetical protein
MKKNSYLRFTETYNIVKLFWSCKNSREESSPLRSPILLRTY